MIDSISGAKIVLADIESCGPLGMRDITAFRLDVDGVHIQRGGAERKVKAAGTPEEIRRNLRAEITFGPKFATIVGDNGIRFYTDMAGQFVESPAKDFILFLEPALNGWKHGENPQRQEGVKIEIGTSYAMTPTNVDGDEQQPIIVDGIDIVSTIVDWLNRDIEFNIATLNHVAYSNINF